MHRKDRGGEATLRRLSELAQELGSERVREEAAGLADRLAEGRFYVACIGQFKRGKSTLLSALLGERVLPAGVVPVTTVPTVIRFGTSKRARVCQRGGTWLEMAPEDLIQYVSEEHNPENTKGVTGAEVFFPSPLLADGMCFVDTPGLGSVFSGNSAATQAFVPHVDAAIVVVGADPPIAGEELALVEEVARQVADLVIVLNKADRASDEDRQIANSFTRQVLEKRLKRAIGPILEISAEERLTHRGPERDWPKLVESLEKLASESGRNLARTSGERGIRRLSEELITITSEEREALVRPMEESERRVHSLRQTIADATGSLRDVSYLFMAEEHRLSDMFLEQRKSFLTVALPKANAELTEEISRLPRRFGPKFRRDAMSAAQGIAERHLLPWLEAEQTRDEEEYRRVALRFVNIANDFLKRLSESGVPELARMPNAIDPERGFRTRSRFTFENLLHVSRPASPLRYLGDLFLGLAGALSVIERDARAFLEHLMEMNSTRVQSDVVDRVQQSRSQLELEIRKLLHEVSRIAERALEHARAAGAQGAAAVEAALQRLGDMEREIRNLQAAAGAPAPCRS